MAASRTLILCALALFAPIPPLVAAKLQAKSIVCINATDMFGRVRLFSTQEERYQFRPGIVTFMRELALLSPIPT